MHNSEKNGYEENEGQQKEREKNTNNKQQSVDVSGHSPEFESTYFTLIKLSQY